MHSKLFIFCIFAIVLMGLVVAQDYEETEEGDGESEDSGEGGGDYDDGGEAAAGDEESDDSSASTMAHLGSLLNSRKKRSLNTETSERVLTRVRRGGYGRVGPVYTYQKTDHKANFKWGNGLN